jgi:Ser/Thr protein kinase RdoA (MazF antagonist)
MELPLSLRDAWPTLAREVAPLGTGLINATYLGLADGARVVVQRVHPVFRAEVHEDIEAVTAHLAAKGLLTLRLVRTRSGALSFTDESGAVWRVSTFLDGVSHDRFPSLAHVHSAGRLVGGFHAALADLEHRYVHVRPGVHDVPFRLAGWERARAAGAAHRLASATEALHRELSPLLALTLPPGATRRRHAHGDLKAANLLFRGDEGIALVDLDTVSAMEWVFELGDALRSWCNHTTEDDPRSRFDLGTLEAALSGYREAGPPLARDEIEGLARGVLTITAELCLRFLTDALEESYFGFDAARFATRGEHNLARARGQLELAKSLAAELPEAERVVRAALAWSTSLG